MKKAVFIILFFTILSPLSSEAKSYRFIIASTPDGSGSIYVDDDLTILLERKRGGTTTILNDANGRPSEISPVFFYAEYGDKLIIEAKDAAKIDSENNRLKGGHRALSPLYLINTELNEAQMISAPLPPSGSIGNDTFVKIEYTIGTPLKEYCVSSSPSSCQPLFVDDDLPLLYISYSDTYTAELHPNTDRNESYIEAYIMIPEDPSSRYGIATSSSLQIEFTNYKRNGYISPVYLVPTDGNGPVLTILDHPLRIEGGCKDNCTDTVMYEFNGTISYILPPTTEEEKIDVNISQIEEGSDTGLWLDIVAPNNFNTPLILYWNTPHNPLFCSPSGYSHTPYRFNVQGHIQGSIWMPSYSPWQRLLIDGNHTLGVAVLSRVPKKTEFNLVVQPLDGDNSTPQYPDESYLNATPTGQPLTTVEQFIADVTKDAFTRGATSTIMDLLLKGPEAMRLGCVRLPPTGTSEGEGITERTCCFVFPQGEMVHDGLAVMYRTDGNMDLIFMAYVYCYQRTVQSSNSTSSNSTQELGTLLPSQTVTTSTFTPDPNLIKLTARVTLNRAPSNVTLNLNRTVPVDPQYLLPNLKGGLLFYNLIHIPTDPSPVIVNYSFSYTLGKKADSTAEHTYAIPAPQARVWTVDHYPGGLQLQPEVTDMGYINIKASFKLQLKPFGNHTPNFGIYNATVCLSSSGNQTESDMCINMNHEGNGVFSAEYYLMPDESGSIQLSYWFLVRDPKGNPVPGELVFRRYTVSYSSPGGVAATISGSHSYTLGEEARFTVGAAVAAENRNKIYDVFLGIYREGRGIDWIYDEVPGGGLLKTSYQKRPMYIIPGSACLNGCQASVWIPTEPPSEFFSPLFVGDYYLILELSDHETGELAGRAYFPFKVKLGE